MSNYSHCALLIYLQVTMLSFITADWLILKLRINME